MCDEAKYILEFSGVSFSDENHLLSQLSGIDLKVRRSDLVLVLLERHNTESPLCDLAQGLLTPADGDVRFMGERWTDMPPRRQSDMRGRIGRVFDQGGWISNLSMYDNILLGRMYHSNLHENEILLQAKMIAHEVGLEDIPMLRPDILRAGDLKKYEWIRAFLGEPSLVLLQNPESNVRDSDVERLVNMVNKERERGCSVVWTTPDEKLFENRNINASLRCRMNDAEMMSIVEDEYA